MTTNQAPKSYVSARQKDATWKRVAEALAPVNGHILNIEYRQTNLARIHFQSSGCIYQSEIVRNADGSLVDSSFEAFAADFAAGHGLELRASKI